MCSPEEIRQLQAALLCFTDSDRNYGDLSKAEQRAMDLANALFITLERLRRCKEGECHAQEPMEESELGGIFHGLAALADSGTLGQLLTPENRALIKATLGGLKEMGMGEAGLRKKDLAAYLRHSGDTDLLVDKHRSVDAIAAKKDR